MSDAHFDPALHSDENIRLLETNGQSLLTRGAIIIVIGAAVCLIFPAVVELGSDIVRILHFAMIGITLIGSLVIIYGLGKLHAARTYRVVAAAHRRSPNTRRTTEKH